MNTTLKVQLRQDVRKEEEWRNSDPVIPKGCMAFSSDKENAFRVGDGTSKWSELQYNSAKSSDVYSWAKSQTKPVYTKSEVGLGNVENKSSSEIRNELTKQNLENAIGEQLNINSIVIGDHAKLSYDTSKNALKISFI